MIRAVIFDWAGTTVDYGCFAPVQAFQEAFAHHGVPVTLEETRKPMGMLKRDHIRTMLRMERIARAWEETHGRPAGEEDVEAVYAQFEPKLFSILNRFSEPKPFAVETAAALREMGLKIGSTTGYTDSMMGVVAPEAARLGYAPDFWISPDGVGGKGRSIINARSETALERPMFRQSVLARRCVIPTTGFYEWGPAGGQKRKYRFQLPGRDRALYLAGLWNDCGGQRRCVILTTAANPSMAGIHDRMPLVLERERLAEWVHSPQAAGELLRRTPPALEHVEAEPPRQLSLF